LQVLETWLILNNTIGNGHLCKIETRHVLETFEEEQVEEHDNKHKDKRVKDDDQKKEEQTSEKKDHEDEDKRMKDDNQKQAEKTSKKEEHEDKDKDMTGKGDDHKKDGEILKKRENEDEDNKMQSERFNREVRSVSSFNTENKTQITLEEQVDQILFCA
jgi:hypothetical protein